MSKTSSTQTDSLVVTKTRIACDGGGGALGHPKTWLDMGQDRQVTCKYCDRLFILDENAVVADHD